MAGRFITLEGIEGVGKTTQLAFIERRLRDAGRSVTVTREPGGTSLGERIREWLLGGTHTALSPDTEALLMFTARAQHLHEVIRPALERGDWVVCDRFSDATFAYQGSGRGVAAALLDCLRSGVQRGLEPDLTLLLDAPVEVGRRRIEARTADHFERESHAFFERVREGYRELARRHCGRMRLIDATQDEAAVSRDIDRHLSELLSRDGRGHE